MRRLQSRTALLALLIGASAVRAEPPPAGGPVAEKPQPGQPAPQPRAENRLAQERSPYLRQHRTNPVDWFPWGEEAFAKARAEGRPVFLSVGYAACHWCHVMEHESFEDAETARRLNEVFVCVKVDREERPDVDRVYMNAVQLLTGRGGWPMTVLLTPDGRPFYGGTYLPRASLQQLIARVQELWSTQREALDQQATLVAGRVQQALAGADLPPASGSDRELLARLEGALAEAFDGEHGGYGSRPKFPPHAELLFALERADTPGSAPGSERGLAQARLTLERMDEGGVHDQVGGGFHRYSTDAVWLVPHFEKMLYDNALLAQAYAGMFARTREPRFARVVRRLLSWVERELRRPGGGYASSLDADTQGHEGVTYTWTQTEVRAVLPPAEAGLVEQLLGIQADGNYDEEASGEATGRNIPHWPERLEAAARARGLAPEALTARLDPLLERLRAARDQRAQPGLDDKEIAAWNGLLLSAFARAGEALAEPAYLERGRALAQSLLTRHRSASGAFLRFPRASGPEIPGFCEDLVHVAEGLLDLAEAGGEARYADEARRLADDLLERFEDREGGGFWASAPGTHEALLARAKEVWDSPIPSDNGTAARLLLRLAARTGEARYRAAAERTLAAYRPLLAHPGMARGVVALAGALALAVRLEASAAPQDLGPGDARAQEGVVTADAWLERAEAAPGSSVRYAVRVRLAPGWHVNGSEAPPGRTATSLVLAAGAPVNHAPPRYPAPQDLGDGLPPGYAGSFWIHGALHVPPGAVHGPRKLALRLVLQPCDPASCREPLTLELPLSLRFGPVDGPETHPALFAR